MPSPRIPDVPHWLPATIVFAFIIGGGLLLMVLS